MRKHRVIIIAGKDKRIAWSLQALRYSVNIVRFWQGNGVHTQETTLYLANTFVIT